ncbi:MAG: ParB/RepB/Spo0J family partition protein [Sphingobacteriales bacterium]|nr:MAG: ParB/RepB/Spo0J family partition protein [Sphingobacteriales bacterium]
MTELKLVPLSAIYPISNYRDVNPPSVKDADVIELSESIKKDGVLQAVLLRPHPKKKDDYQLIFGHRRLMAAGLAGLSSIPANIKDVDDDDILELQVTENMQRKDVHPIDEAVAFKSLVDNKKYSTQEIAARFGKKPEYVAQRIKLNDLIPELQKDFKENKMLLGHAILLCRLTPDLQKEAKKQASGHSFINESVKEVEDWINESVVQDLSKVSWKQDDATLFPQAGACTTCNKRSGAGNLLFADVKQDNRCYDNNCFNTKKNLQFIATLNEVIETKPELHLLKEAYSTMHPSVNNFVQKMKLKILKEYDDFKTSDDYIDYQIKAKGIYLNGYHEGKEATIYLKGKKAVANKKNGNAFAAKEDPAQVIAGIKERLKRKAELDDEKVHSRILEALKDHSTQKQVDAKMKTLPEPESVALLYILWNQLTWMSRDKMRKLLKIKEKTPADLYNSLLALSQGEVALLIRIIMLDKYAGTSPESDNGYIIQKMARSYTDFPCKQFDEEQAAERKAREERAAARISQLHASIKPKLAPNAKKIASGAKKLPKKGNKKKAA